MKKFTRCLFIGLGIFLSLWLAFLAFGVLALEDESALYLLAGFLGGKVSIDMLFDAIEEWMEE
jgi:succinate-acetate transporter protein